jgi:hypothetical protein
MVHGTDRVEVPARLLDRLAWPSSCRVKRPKKEGPLSPTRGMRRSERRTLRVTDPGLSPLERGAVPMPPGRRPPRTCSRGMRGGDVRIGRRAHLAVWQESLPELPVTAFGFGVRSGESSRPHRMESRPAALARHGLLITSSSLHRRTHAR